MLCVANAEATLNKVAALLKNRLGARGGLSLIKNCRVICAGERGSELPGRDTTAAIQSKDDLLRRRGPTVSSIEFAVGVPARLLPPSTSSSRVSTIRTCSVGQNGT